MTREIEAVTAAAKTYRRREAALAEARATLHAAIVAAADAGERQADIADASTYRRESVRRVVDAARRG